MLFCLQLEININITDWSFKINKKTYSLISIRTANSILWSVHNKNKVSILKKIIFKIYKPAYNNTTAKE